MAGRPRMPIGTFGEIAIRALPSGKFQASARFRDSDGRIRPVAATGSTRNAAKTELKRRLSERQRVGDPGDRLSADSSFLDLAETWLEDLRMDPDRSDGTKDVYERQLRSLVMPAFQHFAVREVTVGRVERFLKEQRVKSYSRAKYSRTMLGLVMSFAVRREIVPRNPVKEASPMKKPKRVPKALTAEQIEMIRLAAREWRTGPGVRGPRPDGQVRDLIEVMLGSATRIGEVLAIRKCDVDMTANPPIVAINATLVVRKGVGVIRQPKPKTDESNRVVGVPSFAAEVIRHRLAILGAADNEHLLFSTRHGTPLAPHNVRRTFRDMLKSVGLDGIDITPHAFRRTGATVLTREIDIETAAAVLGHASTSTTREHYAEPDRTVNPRPAEVLQRFAPSAPEAQVPPFDGGL